MREVNDPVARQIERLRAEHRRNERERETCPTNHARHGFTPLLGAKLKPIVSPRKPMSAIRPSLAALATALVCSLATPTLSPAAAQFPYRDPSRPVAERVRDLLGRMTLEEKFWQLFMIPGDLDNPANDYSNGAFGLQIGGATTARAYAD